MRTEETTAATPQTVATQEAHLPLPARTYVGSVIAAGALVLLYCILHVHVTQWALFLSLIALSSLASTLKIHLPLTRSASTMSVSYVVDFTALLLLGPEQAVFVAAGSAISQSTLNVRGENPFYRTLFNIAAIVLTIEGACNLVLSIWLAPRMGIAGVALATAIPAVVVSLAVLPTYLCRRLELPIRRLAFEGALPGLVMLAAAGSVIFFASRALTPQSFVMIGAVGAMTVPVAIAVFKTTFPREEQERIERLLRLRS